MRVDRDSEDASLEVRFDRVGVYQLPDRWLTVSGDGRLAWHADTLTVRGKMGNESEVLWPGVLVNTTLTIRAESAVVVPSVAVQRSQTGNFVFMVKDGKAQMQPVTGWRPWRSMVSASCWSRRSTDGRWILGEVIVFTRTGQKGLKERAFLASRGPPCPFALSPVEAFCASVAGRRPTLA